MGYIDGIEEVYWWMAFRRLEPFGHEWLQTGSICASVMNSQRVKGKVFQATDWLPYQKDKQPASTPKTNQTNLLAYCKANGIQIIDQRSK